MASVGGAKRVRAWDGCADLEELKAILAEKEEEIEISKKHTESLLEDLKNLKAAAEQPKKQRIADEPVGKSSSASAKKLRTNIKQQVLKQMEYSSALKCRSKSISVEIMQLSESDLKSILGDAVFSQASQGSKLIKVQASEDDVGNIFYCNFSKKLRYGAALVLDDGLTFIYHKQTSILTIAGSFRMSK